MTTTNANSEFSRPDTTQMTNDGIVASVRPTTSVASHAKRVKICFAAM